MIQIKLFLILINLHLKILDSNWCSWLSNQSYRISDFEFTLFDSNHTFSYSKDSLFNS